MPLPDVDALSTLGGALYDYSNVVDPTRDRPAAGANAGYCDAAAATHTVHRSWARFQPNGTSAPTLKSHDEVWNNPSNVAPVVARSTQGVYTITYPATVYDEIPAGLPGAVAAGHTVNLRAAVCNEEIGASTLWQATATVSGNVITVKIWSQGASPALADPNDGTIIGVFAT